MATAIFAFLTALLAALPQILTMVEARQVKRNEETDAIVQGDISTLDAGLDRLRKPPVL